MRIVGVIPVRYQSKRFPGKALARIAGKRVVQHVYERASKCPEFSRLIVATDDRRIEKLVLSIGAECYFSRTPHRCGTERVAEAVKGMRADVVVNIQGDEVLLRPSLVRVAIDALLSDESASCGTVCHVIDSPGDFANSDLVKVALDRRNNALYFSRSPIPNVQYCSGESTSMLCHIGIYAFKRKALVRFAKLKPAPLELCENLEQLRLLESGMRVKVGLTNLKNFSLNRPQDIPIVERMLQEEID